MANIALDIKANTSKALGEFKKLSRELDNKFLVQGLKLDVVKNAFRQITKEFDTAVGDQGLKTAESTGQLQRSLQLQLGTLRRFNSTVNKEVSESLTSLLSQLRADGKITGETFKEALDIAPLLDFEGTEEQRKRAFENATSDIAQFLQQSKDLFGGSEAELIRKGISGELSVDDLLNLNLTSAGASGNKFKLTLAKYADALRSTDPSARTEAYLRVIRELQADPDYQQAFKDVRPISALFREISGLFEPNKGLFGALRSIGPDITNLSGRTVNRNLLQVTAKLLGTIFDREKGIFAEIFKSLRVVFGTGDPLNVILTGVEFFTFVLEQVRDFFGGETFRNFLKVFTPIADAIRSLDTKNISIDLSTIRSFISGLGDTIRSFIGKVTDYINGLDTGAISSILGDVASEIAKTIPSIIGLVFASIGKLIGAAFDTFLKADAGGKLLIAGGVLVLFRKQIFAAISGLVGAVTGLFNIRGGIANLFDRGRAPGSSRLGNALRGFEGQVLLKLDNIIRLLRGGGLPEDLPGGRPTRPRRTTASPAAQQRFRRRFGNRAFRRRFRSPIRGGARFRLARRGLTGLNRNLSRAVSGVRPQFNQFRAGFGTTPNTARGFNVAVGASSPGRAFNIGQGFRNLPSTISRSFSGVTRRLTEVIGTAGTRISSISGTVSNRVATLFSSASRRISSLASVATKGVSSIVRRAPQIASAAGRVARTAGGAIAGAAGGATRGLGGLLRRIPRGGLLGALVGGFSIASILGGGDAKASELEGLTPEEKRERRRQDERGKTRGVLGVLSGIGGGALAGGAAGAALGAAGANPFTIAVGGVLGSIVGGIIGEEAVKVLSDDIIDGVTGFAKRVGGFFTGLWEGTTKLAGDGWKAVTNFFGSEGPIQSTFRFVTELPGNLVESIKSGFQGIVEGVKNLPETIWKSITEGFGRLTGNNPDERFLGGVGTGVTLVGENGPELVNLGSGSVVTPQTSFAGLGLTGRSGGGQSINNVVINVNAPGADEFADQLSVQVIEKLDELFQEQSNLANSAPV